MGYENVNELSFYTEKWLPVWGQRFDQEDPYCADGHSSDEGAWEWPGDVDWPSVQPGQVLRHHARAQEDVARVHGQDPPQIRKLLRGRGSHKKFLYCNYLSMLIDQSVICLWVVICKICKMLYSKTQFHAACSKDFGTWWFTLLYPIFNEFVIRSIWECANYVFPLS